MNEQQGNNPWSGTPPPPEPSFQPPRPPSPPPPPAAEHETQWERGVLEKLAFAALKEQRSARRWSIFFRMMVLGFFILVVLASFDLRGMLSKPESVGRHTALVKLEGVIDTEGQATAEKINQSLRAAFKEATSQAVILRINSPGGSPVQAGMINDEIRRLRKEFPNKPLYVVVEEMCASGGYYVAAAADQIFVNKASLVGSIGVLMDGFGFEGLMDKLGVERRLLTAGENKGFLDPFSPMDERQRTFALSMLGEIHQQFVEVVRAGRGKRLKENPEMFSGLFWTGAKSIELGLADGVGTVESVARDVVKAEDLVDYTVEENFAERLAKKVGAAFGGGAAKTVVNQVAEGGWRLR
jgi:protease-4